MRGGVDLEFCRRPETAVNEGRLGDGVLWEVGVW